MKTLKWALLIVAMVFSVVNEVDAHPKNYQVIKTKGHFARQENNTSPLTVQWVSIRLGAGTAGVFSSVPLMTLELGWFYFNLARFTFIPTGGVMAASVIGVRFPSKNGRHEVAFGGGIGASAIRRSFLDADSHSNDRVGSRYKNQEGILTLDLESYYQYNKVRHGRDFSFQAGLEVPVASSVFRLGGPPPVFAFLGFAI